MGKFANIKGKSPQNQGSKTSAKIKKNDQLNGDEALLDKREKKLKKIQANLRIKLEELNERTVKLDNHKSELLYGKDSLTSTKTQGVIKSADFSHISSIQWYNKNNTPLNRRKNILDNIEKQFLIYKDILEKKEKYLDNKEYQLKYGYYRW
jgi:hypothetical protein